ncbi:MAG: hypothetical protein PHD40_07645 [Syntrophomonadaceae bacterium]|nr:hypothetical protein [Syntrophomonadaceae bacterium]
MSDNFDRELQELKLEIQELKEQLSRTGQGGQQDLKDFGSRLINQVEDMLRDSLEKARQPIEKAGDYSRNLIETGEKKIEEKPLVSILAAFGVGLLVARLLERK